MCSFQLLLQVLSADAVLSAGVAAGVNLRKVDTTHVGVSLDETTRLADVDVLLKVRMDRCCFPFSIVSYSILTLLKVMYAPMHLADAGLLLKVRMRLDNDESQ